MTVTIYANTALVDIHGMFCDDAKRELEKLLNTLEPHITELVVIHGYHDGTVLQNMVRNRLKHRRIKRKLLSLNKGQTTLVLKQM